MKNNKTLGDAFSKEQRTEREAVIKNSKAIVKPDTRKLPASRKGKKQVATWVRPEGHQQVKIAAALRDCTIEGFVRDALNAELRAMGRSPIA